MDGGRASRSWLDLEMGFLDQVTRTAEVRIEQEQEGGQGTWVALDYFVSRGSVLGAQWHGRWRWRWWW